jgi:hypothetical protein
MGNETPVPEAIDPELAPALPVEAPAPPAEPDEAPVVNPFFNHTWPTGAPQ